MGHIKNRIINEKTSVIRRPPPPPAPPPKRVVGTTLQEDADKVVDKMVEEIFEGNEEPVEVDERLEYVGYDPVQDRQMYKQADGSVMYVDRALDDTTNYSTVLELHKMLQHVAETRDWDTTKVKKMNELFNEEQKMGYTPPPAPRKSKKIRKPSPIRTPEPVAKTEKQLADDAEERIFQKDMVECEKLESLAMHESRSVVSDVSVMRVPGGLIYTTKEGYGNTRSISTVFVPWQ